MIRTFLRLTAAFTIIMLARVAGAAPATGQITFAQLLSQIERTSPRLADAKAALATAKSEYTGSRALQNPELFYSEENLRLSSGDETERTTGITQDMSFLWKAPQSIRSFSARYEAASMRFQEEKLSVQCDVLIQLKKLSKLNSLIGMTDSISLTLTSLFSSINARQMVGDIRSLDVVRFKQALLHFAGQRASLREDYYTVIQELMELTGLNAETVDKVFVGQTNLALPFGNVTEALEFSAEHSFALKFARFESVAANREVSARKWSMVPNVSLGLGRKVINGGIDGPVVEAQIELPLFSQGRSELSAAAAQRNRAIVFYATRKNTVRESIVQMWRELDQIEADLELSTSSSGMENANQAIKMYSLGELSALETVDMLQSILESESTLADLGLRQQALIRGIIVASGYPIFDELASGSGKR